MANILNISTKSRLKFEGSVKSRSIQKTFGRQEDIVELHILDLQDNVLLSDHNFTDYTFADNKVETKKDVSDTLFPTSKEPSIVNPDAKGAGTRDYKTPGPRGQKEGYWFNTGFDMVWVEAPQTSTSVPPEEAPDLLIDPIKVLNDKGFTLGRYKLKLNFQRSKIFNLRNEDVQRPFTIKEVSSTRREIRSIALHIGNSDFEGSVGSFISEIENSVYFRDFTLNFGRDINIVGINLLLNKNATKSELLIKTLDPLPNSVSLSSKFSVVEDVLDPITLDVDLGEPEIADNTIPLQGPNFKIDVRINNSIPSAFKNYNEVLEHTATSSYNHLLNKLEKDEILNIQYDYIRPVSESFDYVDGPFHFENFVHFGSAVERVKNFEYKVKLIDIYNGQLNDIKNITGNTSSSFYVKTDKENIETKKRNLIKGFDGYENFLYFESGTYSWPKQNSTKPYELFSITSSKALNWLGSEKDTSNFYGGQLLSASFFDNQNTYALKNLIPAHIQDNTNNEFYLTFTHMIGHHFDQIWTHIKAITDIKDTHHTRGISRDLVYFALKSLGVETFDQFENDNLIEYILGEGSSGSAFYDTPVSQSLVTASNEGSIPKGDITKEIWKRLYHNAPYLLKTKGTERGVKALMSCYGVPSTILNVKEYGGSTKKDSYKVFSYEKSGLALTGETLSNSASGYFIKTDWSSSNLAAPGILDNQRPGDPQKTVEFRILPKRSTEDYHLFSLSGSKAGVTPLPHFDTHLILNRYTGNDISSSGDSIKYGRLQLYIGNELSGSTAYFPAFNGDPWNIHISADRSTDRVHFGAYQSNHLGNVSKHITSSDIGNKFGVGTDGIYFDSCWYWSGSFSGPFQDRGVGSGSAYAFFGGVPSANTYTPKFLGYSGSMQEIRYYGERLSHETHVKHALEPFMYAGNNVSSSFENLVLRLPLGSNCHETYKTSHHPNPNVNPNFNFSSSILSNMASYYWKEIIETHHLPTPDTVGISPTSEKVRIDEGTIDDDILSLTKRTETSTLDRQPQDYEDLGIFLSPTNELNEDIVYTLGAFRLDDYIGSPLPSSQTSSYYSDLKELKDLYFKKVEKRYDYWDYIKTIQYIDHTLFKLIEQWVPFKANTKTGLLIEPHFLERSKFPRELPVIDDGQTMIPSSYNTIEFELDPNNSYTLASSSMGGGNVVTTNNLSINRTGSDGKRIEQGTNTTVDLWGDYMDPFRRDPNTKNNHSAQAPIKPFSSSLGKGENYTAYKSRVLLGNATKGRISDIHYRAIRPTGNFANYSSSFKFEFNDSNETSKGWFGVRYGGSKLESKDINVYSPSSSDWKGDTSYGLNPVVSNKTQAVYVANTIIGGSENEDVYTTLEDHSYIGIQKILLINKDDDTIEIIDKETEAFDDFHRFITSDFPTGNKFNLKILDPSIQHNLEGSYFVKMNKGYLLKSFTYSGLDEGNRFINNSGSASPSYGSTNTFRPTLNPFELFDSVSQSLEGGNTNTNLLYENNRLAFQYGKQDSLEGMNLGTNSANGTFESPSASASPNYVSSSITMNKFTREFYSGSIGFPDHNGGLKGAFYSASRFIGHDCVKYLKKNHQNTELHLTLNRGTVNMAPGFNDERSMGTFEVDRTFLSNTFYQQDAFAFTTPFLTAQDTPFFPILQLKGGSRFTPTTPKINGDTSFYILYDVASGHVATKIKVNRDYYLNGGDSPEIGGYSGSLTYQLSFLDKDHTLIANINKNTELFDGIGTKGVVLIPEFLDGTIKKNLEYYLEKAGLIDKATNLKA
jgi:hypothetical protein